jgi:Fur family peroxide stress response transcriptional regulator
MNRTPREITRMMEKFDAAVRKAGVKRTPQRAAIYREVARTDEHPDIDVIFKAVRRTLPSISLDTVYRALALFIDLGLVSTIRPRGHHVRYDANTSLHHHFVCTKCGAAIDFEHRDFDNLSIPAAAFALGRVASRHVELRGLCAPCAAGASEGPAASFHRPIGKRSHR